MPLMKIGDSSLREARLQPITPDNTCYHGFIPVSAGVELVSLGFSDLHELLPIRVDAPPVAEEQLIALVLNGVSSPHTRRAYRTGLDEFFSWLKGRAGRPVFG